MNTRSIAFGHKKSGSLLAIALTLAACGGGGGGGGGGATVTPETTKEDTVARVTNSENFSSTTSNMKLDLNGNYTVNNVTIAPSKNLVNGMPTYTDTTINGVKYQVLSTGQDTGRSLYFLAPENQFYAIGTADKILREPATIGHTTFAGKYSERALQDGALGEQKSGRVELTLDAGAGTLNSTSGPANALTYSWDATQGKFVGTGTTKGETVATNTSELLGAYQVDGSTSQMFGTFWAIGQ